MSDPVCTDCHADPPPTLAEAVEVIEALLGYCNSHPAFGACGLNRFAEEFLKRAKGKT